MSRRQRAIEQIGFARNYTVRLLEQTPASEWFRPPPFPRVQGHRYLHILSPWFLATFRG